MALTAAQINDLVENTQIAYTKMKYQDLTQTLQKYYGKRLWEQYSEDQPGGQSIQWTVQTASNNNTRSTGFFATDSITSQDLNSHANVGWRIFQTAYQLEHNIMAQNESPNALVNYAMQQYETMWRDFWYTVENWIFGHFTSDNGTNPFPLRYYIVKEFTGNADGGTISGGTGDGQGDFTGDQYWSGTNCAGLSNAQWKNFCNLYSSVDEQDAIDKLFIAFNNTDFEAVVPYNSISPDQITRGIYCQFKTFNEFRKAARAQNDNLGFDFANGANATFYGVPFTAVRQLNYDLDYPIYGVDWSTMKFVFNSNMKQRRTLHESKHGQHMVTEVFYDWQGNLKCVDRRRQFVLAKGSSY